MQGGVVIAPNLPLNTSISYNLSVDVLRGNSQVARVIVSAANTDTHNSGAAQSFVDVPILDGKVEGIIKTGGLIANHTMLNLTMRPTASWNDNQGHTLRINSRMITVGTKPHYLLLATNTDFPQSWYNNIMRIDGTSTTYINAANADRFVASTYVFHIIEHLERNYSTAIWQGHTTLADKIRIAKQIVKRIAFVADVTG